MPDNFDLQLTDMTSNESVFQQDLSLNELTPRLHSSYYGIMQVVCAHASSELRRAAKSSAINLQPWIIASEAWLESLSKYLDQRVTVVVPYLMELYNKESTGHNCSECSGKCDMQHAAKLAELDFSNTRITQSHFEYLESTKRHNEGPAIAEVALVRACIQLLNSYLLQLVDLERTALIPGIKAAQKTIKVYVEGS